MRARRLPYAVGLGGAGRWRGDRAGQGAGDRLLDGGGQLGGTRQALVGEHPGQPRRVPLSDGPDLPGALAAVQLQCVDGGLGVQTGKREGGDLGAVESGDGGEGRGGGAEPGRSSGAHREGEQHGDPVHRLGQGLQVDGEAVAGRGLPGDLQAGEPVRAGVGDPLGAAYRAALVGEGGTGHDG